MSKKGPQFERDFSRDLSLWWSKGKSNQIFWRTSQSGGRMTTLAKKGESGKFHHGDICAIDPDGQPLIDFCTIELKIGYPRASIMALLDRPPNCKTVPIYSEWIAKARKQAELSESYGWMLVHRHDRREALAFMPIYVFSALELEPDVSFADDLGCVRLKAFFDVNPNIIREFQAEREIT